MDVICQEHCHIYFHLSCWKDYKESLSEVEKLSEKDFLGRACLTPDCLRQDTSDEHSVIVKVRIIGPDGEEKSSCECIPLVRAPCLVRKESETVYKSPKKKPRKKDTDKNDRNASKKTRHNSRSQGETSLSTAPKKNMNGYTDALSKLAAARKHNFGYDIEAPDPSKVRLALASPSSLGKDEEFVYSYFLEIFKREGYMTIFKLQEHWEANKELLPALEPALITHTDLVKFLLDTEGFAVVQDMIGISSELPNISAIVEAKAEVPQPVVYAWKPSPATVLEASKTLSFASVSNDGETVSEEIESKPRSEDVFFFGANNRLSTSEESSATDCSSYKSAKDELEYQRLPEADKQLLGQTPPMENELLYDKHWKKMVEPNLSVTKGDQVECFTKKEDNNIILNVNAKVFKSSSSELSFKAVKAAQSLSSELTVGKREYTFNSSQGFPVVAEEPIKAMGVLTSNGHAVDTSADSNTASVKPPVATDSCRVAKSSWKPRAKLLEWACETFPGESKVKLWEALTRVRALNNYTLSGLSFEIIEERVKDALLSLEGDA